MVRRMGRTTIQGGKLYLFWTASGIDFCFRGERISVVFTAGFTSMEQWISMELDGFFLLRMPLHRGENRIDLLQGLDAGVMHRIRLFREVQMIPDDNACFLTLDCLQYEGEITAPPEASLTIEFVGDSITSGEGSCGAQMEEDWISPYFGVENNYARMTADILNARFSCISQSGWGIVSDYQNNPHRVLPRFYEQICGVTCCRENILAHAHDPFDFSADPSDIVVVNLGTNDDGAFHAEPYFDPETMSVFCQQLDEFGRPQMKDAERLQGAVVAFLQKIRRYNPHAQIIWCYGMLGDSIPGALRIRQPHRFCHPISGSFGDNRPAATHTCCRFLFTIHFLLRFAFFVLFLCLSALSGLNHSRLLPVPSLFPFICQPRLVRQPPEVPSYGSETLSGMPQPAHGAHRGDP